MFSTTALLTTGIIVALLGGSLPDGVWTHHSEKPSPAERASATADDTTTPDVLPGVDLVTEEVEPGVVRVISDGHRAVSPTGIESRVIARDDGRVWVVLNRGFYELGREAMVEFPGIDFMLADDQVTVGPDGSFYKRGLAGRAGAHRGQEHGAERRARPRAAGCV